jgi:hypothetical protein
MFFFAALCEVFAFFAVKSLSASGLKQLNRKGR